MSLLWNSPFSPLLLLTGGAFLLLGLGHRLDARLRYWLPAAAAGLASLAWLLLRLRPEGLGSTWSWTAPLGLTTTITFQLNGWAWLAGLCVMTVAFVAVNLPGWRQRPGFSDPRAWVLLLATCSLFIALAGNWLALLSAWALLGAVTGLVAGPEAKGSASAWAVGILSTLLLLLVPLFNGGASLTTALEGQHLNSQAQLLLILATVIPLAAYPFHVWLAPHVQRSPGRQLAVHILPAIAALYLLGRFSLPLLASQAWAPLLIVALLGSALATWSDRDDRRAWAFVLINRSTWALLALSLTQLPPPEGAVFPLVALALGSALWALARVAKQQRGWRWPMWLAVAVLYGLPLTPGFPLNLAVGQLAGRFIGVPGWALVLLAQTLLVAYFLLQRLPEADEPVRGPGTAVAFAPPAFLLALGLCLVFVIRFGLLPITLSQILGRPESDLFAGAAGPIRSAGLSAWLTLLIPLLPGVALAVYDERLFGALRGWQDNTAAVARLNWLHAGGGRLLRYVSVYTGYLADLIDGAGQFGWVLLAILVAWYLLRA